MEERTAAAAAPMSSVKSPVETIPEEQASASEHHDDDDKGACKLPPKQPPPPKPARSSLANKDAKADAADATARKMFAADDGALSSEQIDDDDGEVTENEGRVASSDKPDNGRSTAAPTGGEEKADPPRARREGDEQYLDALHLQPPCYSQDLLKSPALSEAHGAGAILDLSGETKEQHFSENRYLSGFEMHEFHSSSSPAVSCELRTDSIGGRERGRSIAEVKELAYARLQEELQKAQEELKLKDEEVARLSRIRDEVLAELEELTACLFQEAHEMVRQANIKQAFAEKSLKEANMKIEVLQAELKALKALVITSTPSMPNRHLHPHLDVKKESSSPPNNGIGLLRSHKRSPSHNNLKYGRDPTPPSSPEKGDISSMPPFCPENYEIDPIYHKEFVSWRENPLFDKTHVFLIRVYREDIEPCLNFTNRELASKVQSCVESNSITIEAVSGKSSFPKRCALSEAPRLCKYRMRLNEDDQWFYISQLCRNRIAAVCDFLSYLRYIQQGLVRSGVHDVYWEIIRLRKNMALARLGINS